MSATDPAPTTAPDAPLVSVVIPMHNEGAAIPDLIAGVARALDGMASAEIIAVDDGSTDDTLTRLRTAQATQPRLRVLSHDRCGGQSAAVHSGVMAARAPICCTLDGDGQNPPEELPKLWQPILDDASGTVALVAGQRQGRKDTLSKKLASRAANAIRGRILRDGTRDTGCGLKGFRTEAFRTLPYFDHMHRYLPALFKAHGWDVALVDVSHRPRVAGQSKYTNLGRAIAGAWDLLGVVWLIRRAKKSRASEV